MARMFISYRRSDSQAVSDRIHDHLSNHFGVKNVFKDVDDIPQGVDFRQVLERAAQDADVMLVIIGPTWTTVKDSAGNLRLWDDRDFVRLEVEAGLKNPSVMVVPVLVNNAQMPAASQLPPSLQQFAYLNARQVRHDPDFRGDIQRLIRGIEAAVPTKKKSRRWLFTLPVFLIVVVVAAIALMALLSNPPGNNPIITEPVDIGNNGSSEPEPSETPEVNAQAIMGSADVVIDSKLGTEIAERGTIRIGTTSTGLYPVNYIEDGDPEGFEIELAYILVDGLFGSAVEIELVPLSASDRFAALANGEIDLLIRYTAHTASREDQMLFSEVNYFLDGLRLMTRRSSGINNLSDLDGGILAVAGGTATERDLRIAIEEVGYDIQILNYETTPDSFNAYLAGEADAVAGDWLYLLDTSHEQGDTTSVVVGDLLSYEPYAVAMPLGNDDFREEVDEVLLWIIHEDIWQGVYEIWFTDPPPWTTEQMAFAEPADR